MSEQHEQPGDRPGGEPMVPRPRRVPLLLGALAAAAVLVLVTATLALRNGSGSDDQLDGTGPLGSLAATSGDRLDYRAVDAATGKPVSLVDLRGHATLLAAWATWCAPCRTELPRLEKLARDRAATGLRVVTVNVDDAGADKAVALWTKDLQLTVPVWRDRTNEFMTTFETPVLPAAVLLDADGVVVERWVGLLRTNDRSVTKVLDRVTRG